jgi:hypothetical protein
LFNVENDIFLLVLSSWVSFAAGVVVSNVVIIIVEGS